MQLSGLWPSAKFHTQIWQFSRSVHISETAARRAKISSISNPWVEKEYICNFWNLGQWQGFMPKYGSWKISPYLPGAKFSSRTPRPMVLLFRIYEIVTWESNGN